MYLAQLGRYVLLLLKHVRGRYQAKGGCEYSLYQTEWFGRSYFLTV